MHHDDRRVPPWRAETEEMVVQLEPRPAASADSHAGHARRVAFRLSREYLMVSGVLLVTALVCLRSLGNEFVLDDQIYIVGNRFIGQWSFLTKALYRDEFWFIDPKVPAFSAYYRPVWLYWYWLNYRLFGLHPMGWHATTAAVHLTAVWLVYRIARILGGELDSALLAALLFGLLPVHAEAISWPAAVDMPLVATLELAAFYLFIARRNPARSISPSALLVYGFALLAHESAVTFPALIAAYVFFLESPAGERTLRTRARLMTFCLAPFVAETVVYLILHELVVGAISRPMVGDHLTYGQALMSMPGALAIYLRLLVVPWAAGPAHRLLPPAGLAAPDFWIAIAIVVVAAGIFGLAIRNSSRRRLYLFCAAWMAISIAPAMNLPSFRSDMIVQDRYLYLPSVGWCLMIAIAVAGFARRNLYRQAVSAAAAALLVVYAAALWNAQHYWHDDFTLCRTGVEEFPGAAIWHAQLSGVLEQQHDIAGAVREIEQWRNLTRDFHSQEGGRGLQALGLLHAQVGRNQEAEIELRLGLQVEPTAPATSYTKLADLYDLGGNEQASEQALKSAESLPDGPEEVPIMRARIEMRHGDRDGAEKVMRDVAGHYPNDQRVWTMLGLLLTDENRDDEALAAYQRSISLAPQDPRPYLYAATLLHAKGRDREALDDCRLALQIDPHDPNAASLMNELTHSSAQH
jgi:tetratricopeptide (TPR) repeat protein